MEKKFKEYTYKGQKFKIYFVSKDKLGIAFGRAYLKNEGEKSYGEVREDLNPVIKKFVIEHELYHLTDKSRCMGIFGMELRANIIPGLKNPIGLFMTILATLFSLDRIKFYLGKLNIKK
ncbi:MAG: hypothetical protein WCW54_00220 [Candidatus Paceibacterota bacterium]